eukprot:8794463-Alexandrium_andersonii.AAC.1
MSASLVGSEMCIRDSRRLNFSQGVVRGRSCFYRGTLGHWDTGMLGQWGPVSYTHLTLPTICSV